jgi:hypothetical protein
MTVKAATLEAPPASCPITIQQSVFIPPAPYPGAPSSGFYFGTEKLWTQLNNSVWSNLPLWPEGYRQKIAWWTRDYDTKASLTISGRRLDGNDSFFNSEANRSYRDDMGNFIMSAVNIPTTGCWEITGRLGEEQLQFVVWVTK